jgi:hypothetical protein
MSKPPRSTPNRSTSWIVTDPAEIAASDEALREHKKTAAYKVGCEQVYYAPLPLLAQYIVELEADERQEFLNELTARLPADLLAPLIDALRARLDAPAA